VRTECRIRVCDGSAGAIAHLARWTVGIESDFTAPLCFGNAVEEAVEPPAINIANPVVVVANLPTAIAVDDDEVANGYLTCGWWVRNGKHFPGEIW